MKTDSIVLSAAALTPAASKLLHEGSSVFVRILHNLGGGRYSASFGGGTFSIASELPLQEGSAFSARIQLDGGKILLVREPGGSADASVMMRLDGAFGNAGAVSNPALAAYFKKLGLVPDNLSLALYREMRQLGMKFDEAALGRARAVAERLSGRESSAAQAALILERKGLRADSRTVQKILGGGRERRNGAEPQERGARGFREFFASLLSGGEEAVPGGAPGLLALFNHTGFSPGTYRAEGNWICIPFDFSYCVSEADFDGGVRRGTGDVRIFLRPDMRFAEKIAVNFTFSQKKYDFILYMKSGTCVQIHVAPPAERPPAEAAGLLAAMQERLGIPVVQAADGADSAFPAEPDAIGTAGGFA